MPTRIRLAVACATVVLSLPAVPATAHHAVLQQPQLIENLGLYSFEIVPLATGFLVTLDEANHGDLNGDGDTGDHVVHVVRSPTDIVNLGVAGDNIRVSPDGLLAAFPSGEFSQGDLNGDGDTFDRVVQIYDVTTGTLFNTGIGVATSGLREIVLSDSAVLISATESATGDLNGDGDAVDNVFHIALGPDFTPINLGLANLFIRGGDTTPSARFGGGGGVFGISVGEFDQGADLNADGDEDDSIAYLVDGTTGTATSLGFETTQAWDHRDGIVFWLEGLDGEIRFHDAAAGTTTLLSPHGGFPIDAGGRVAFLGWPGSFFDDVHLYVYDPATGTTTSAGGPGVDDLIATETHIAYSDPVTLVGGFVERHPFIYNMSTGGLLELDLNLFNSVGVAVGDYFAIFEHENGEDLDGDGLSFESFFWLYDPVTGRLVNLKESGPVGVALGSWVPYGRSEFNQRLDLNGDGDQDDNILALYDMATGRDIDLGLDGGGGAVVRLSDGSERIAVTVSEDGVDLNGDGDTDDWLIHLIDVGAISDNLAPVADAGPDVTVSWSEVVNNDGVAEITLDATATTDPNGDLLRFNWLGDFQAKSIPGQPVAPGFARGATPDVLFDDIGTYRIDLVVSDGFGGRDTDSVTITIVDGSPGGGAGSTLEIDPSIREQGGRHYTSWTVTLLDATADPLPGVAIDIDVAGPNVNTLERNGGCIAEGNILNRVPCETDTAGQLQFFMATNGRSGDDVITVRADVDGDGLNEATEPTATAVMTTWIEIDQNALGDSYASGEGAPPYQSSVPACRRSLEAWAKQLVVPGYAGPLVTSSSGLGSFQFPACAAARTFHVYADGAPGIHPPVPQYGLPPQVATLSNATDLVTMTIGGNDAGFGDVLKLCAAPFVAGAGVGECTEPGFDPPDAVWRAYRDANPGATWTDYMIEQHLGVVVRERLRQTYREIKEDAPNATVFVLDYPYLMAGDEADEVCGVAGLNYLSAFDPSERDFIRTGSAALSAVIQQTAGEAGFHFFSVRSAFSGHEPCTADEWIHGVIDLVGPGSFHPNARGVRGYANVLNAGIAAAVGADPDARLPNGLPPNPPGTALLDKIRNSPAPQVVAPESDDWIGALEVTPVTAPAAPCAPDYLHGPTVHITGEGFAPDSSVEVSVGFEDAGTVVATVDAGNDGAIDADVNVPSEVSGFNLIAASGIGPDGESRLLMGPISIVEEPEPCESNAPVVTITAPMNGGTYTADDVVLADYTCTDDTSGVECIAPVPSGTELPPSNPGTHTFRVTGVDVFGNATSVEVDYEVLSPVRSCLGLEATITGTEFDDVLTGTPEADVIWAGSGDDTITGEGGDDVICSGDGDDTVDAGEGNDVVDAEGGSDMIHLGSGDDFANGGPGRDTITGGTGDDVIDGGAGRDDISGDAGEDTLVGGGGDDRLIGGADNDVADGGGGNDEILGDEGDDILSGGAEDDDLYGGAGNDSVTGDTGDDHLHGDAGSDTLSGGGGDDTADGGTESDAITGGAGADTLRGDEGDDTIDGGADADVLRGGPGADVLIGAGGDDSLFGDEGNDLLTGGAGDDRIRGDIGDDQIIGGGGVDDIRGGDGDDTITGDAGNDAIHGGAGADTIDGGGGDDNLRGSDGDDVIAGGAGADTIGGAAGSDELSGEAGDDSLTGGSQDDLLDGGPGTDRLRGGPGEDTCLAGEDVGTCEIFDP